MLFEARGQYSEAIEAYRRSEAFRRATIADIPRFEYKSRRSSLLLAADNDLLSIARIEAKLGLFSQAEADARRALLGVLKAQSKYNPQTPKFIIGLAGILVEQGRYEDAEKLALSALEVQRTLGIGDDTPASANILSQLGGVLTLLRKDKEAAEIYAQLDKAVAQWEPQRRDVFLLNGSRISCALCIGPDRGRHRCGPGTGQATGRAHGRQLVRNRGRARRARHRLCARRTRRGCDPRVSGCHSHHDGGDARQCRRRRHAPWSRPAVSGCRASWRPTSACWLARASKSNDLAVETFALADAVRGRSVQQALAASSARMIAKDPALAELARNEQDLGKQISAQLGILNNVLALPAGERDENVVRGHQRRASRSCAPTAARRAQEINRRFPSYADLIDPKPPSVEQIEVDAAAGRGVALVLFRPRGKLRVGVPKDGAVAFATIATDARRSRRQGAQLRAALEPNRRRRSTISRPSISASPTSSIACSSSRSSGVEAAPRA